VTSEFHDESRYAFTSSVGFVGVMRRSPVEASGNVSIAKAGDGMLSRHGGAKERQVTRGERVEPGVAPSGFGSWPAQGVQRGDAFAFEWSRGQCVEVAAVGGDADLVVAPEVADALSHLTPPPLAPAIWGFFDPQAPELNRDLHRFGGAETTSCLVLWPRSRVVDFQGVINKCKAIPG
jgi:hypothetical protein